MVTIIVKGKGYAHYNRAMGKHIRSERHYKEEMKRGNYCTADEAKDRARRHYEATHKPYKASQKARDILNSCHPDRKGNVRMSDVAIDELRNMGACFDKEKIEKHIKEAENAL